MFVFMPPTTLSAQCQCAQCPPIQYPSTECKSCSVCLCVLTTLSAHSVDYSHTTVPQKYSYTIIKKKV